ncbi:MAG: Kef family K(+) transporter [Gemmatimonas sp.]|nr:Kef family K(+) transporter [Gemmatimonas sp.]
MPHSVTLISTIAGAFVLALILGYIAVRLRMPALVGYLIAGVVMGPYTPGFTGDIELIQQLAEIGVMLLMFGVGLHLSLEDLLSVRRIAVPGAVLQIGVATLLGAAVAHYWWHWDAGAAVVFGLSLSCASTVVLLRALEARGSLETLTGRIAVGWLVMEDIAMVVALVLMPPLAAALGSDTAVAGSGSLAKTLSLTMGSVVLFVVLMFVVGRRVFPWLLLRIAGTGSRELFTLAVMAAGVGIAYAAGVIFGVSYALGAFFAGMVMRESEFSHRAADESLPFRDAFAVLFFVSVGMLFDPALLWEEPLKILTVLFIIIIGKSIAAFGLVLIFRYPLNTALTVSAALAQIGEFSFILAGMGVALGLLSLEGQNLILAGAVISIALNPVVFSAIEPARKWILKRSRLARYMARPNDRLAELPHSFTPAKLTNHLLIVGYGRVGRRIGEALKAQNLTFVVAEQNREIVARLRAEGIPAVAGDATEPEVLIQAHVSRARALVIATPDTIGVKAIMDIAHRLRPELPVIVRTHGDNEAEELRHEPRVEVFMGEEELAKAMLAALLREVKPNAA